MLLWDIPDADGDMVARPRTFAFGLTDVYQPASDGCKPSADVVLVGCFHDRFSVAAYQPR